MLSRWDVYRNKGHITPHAVFRFQRGRAQCAESTSSCSLIDTRSRGNGGERDPGAATIVANTIREGDQDHLFNQRDTNRIQREHVLYDLDRHRARRRAGLPGLRKLLGARFNAMRA